VTPGDPRGIGPEVAARALVALDVPAVLVGHGPAIAAAADAAGLVLQPFTGWNDVRGVALLAVDEAPEELAALRIAVDAAKEGLARAVVTGPVHKARLSASGAPFTGHTGWIGARCGVPEPVMAFVGGPVGVVLATVHLPLRDVADALDAERLLHVLRTTDGAWRRHIGPARLVVCGVNPHAGEGGTLGTEERDVIGPAVKAARADGIDAVGPVSAETAWRERRRSDVIVAMYHDQGLAPLKALAMGRTVNWTLGLPIVRTSVDHGTADALVGTGRASPSSMVAAIRWARRLTGRRARP
jgi:4-hydroxythreonine-4-phosphate dehydrogenase